MVDIGRWELNFAITARSAVLTDARHESANLSTLNSEGQLASPDYIRWYLASLNPQNTHMPFGTVLPKFAMLQPRKHDYLPVLPSAGFVAWREHNSSIRTCHGNHGTASVIVLISTVNLLRISAPAYFARPFHVLLCPGARDPVHILPGLRGLLEL